MPVPVLNPGDVLTASTCDSWFLPRAAYKAADLGRTATVNSADPDLTVAVDAFGVYTVEMLLFYHSSSTSGNLTWQFLMPSGAVGSSAGWYTGSGGGALNGDEQGLNYTGFKAKADAVAFNADTVTLKGLLQVSSTSGNFQLSWAGDTSGPTVTLQVRSYLLLRRVG